VQNSVYEVDEVAAAAADEDADDDGDDDAVDYEDLPLSTQTYVNQVVRQISQRVN